MESKEVAVLKRQVSNLEKQANEVTIATPEQNLEAMTLKAKLKEIGKTIKDRKEEITKPLNEALKSARALFAPLEEQFESAERIVGRRLLDYKQMVDEQARKEEAKIAAKVEAGRMKVETAEKKLEQVQYVEKTTKTDHGQVQFRKVPKVRIVNENLIPDKYWEINMVELRKDVVTNRMVVPGAEFYEEETV